MTPTAMAYRTAVPVDKAAPVAEVPAAAVLGVEVLAVACPRAVVASTRRGEHPTVLPAQSPAHTLGLY